jgi:ankyrin repeat protein
MDSTELDPELIQTFVGNAHGNLAVVQELLEQEPRLLNAKWERFDENALEASGHMGRADIATYLLDKGAPLTIFAAAMLGNIGDVAAFLRDNPELATANGVHGISILCHAALSGKVEVADLLVAHGGGTDPSTGISAAVQMGHREMVDWLLARGANPNTLDFRGKTPLDIALVRSDDDIADVLRAHGGTESAPASKTA